MLQTVTLPRPPAPVPRAKPLGLVALLRVLATNPLEAWTDAHFEEPIVSGDLPFGRAVVVSDPAAIRRTALFTVEGERDDICSVGQTVAAHALCSGIFANRKRHHLQPGVGHYGVFSGRKWANQIYPLVRNMILATN